MAKAAKKSKKPVVAMIEFSRSRDIPFNRIHLSKDNVRETDVEAGLDDLTHDIDRREDIVQGLNVRAILDADGNETGDFETPAGGRRHRAIARLVAAGRFPRTASSLASSRRRTRRPPRSMTRSPRTCGAWRCIRSTSSGRSSACSTTA